MELRLRLTLTVVMNGLYPLVGVQMVKGLWLLGIDMSKFIPPTLMDYYKSPKAKSLDDLQPRKKRSTECWIGSCPSFHNLLSTDTGAKDKLV